MFLRAAKRFKDGKTHYCWSLVENVRVGRRVFQRRALYLGELNDSQQKEWQHAVEAFDEKGNVRQQKLFPEDRAPEGEDGQVVRIRMDSLAVKNMRNWGEAWLGTELWDKLGLDGFWTPRRPSSRKGTDWLAIMKAIVMYRPHAPTDHRKVPRGQDGRCRDADYRRQNRHAAALCRAEERHRRSLGSTWADASGPAPANDIKQPR